METNVTALGWDEAEQKSVLQNFLIQRFLDSKRNKKEAWIQWSYLSTSDLMGFSVCCKSRYMSQLFDIYFDDYVRFLLWEAELLLF